MSTDSRARTASHRHYLMCPPTYYTVDYSINPWMDPSRPTDTAAALAEWERLRCLYLELGHRVDLIEPVPGLPDMVYAANGATVSDGTALVASFRHHQRAREAAAFAAWFVAQDNYEVVAAKHINEGEGDYLVAGTRVLAGTGFRTEIDAHTEAEQVLGLPVTTLKLVDPHYYHLDTALAVLDEDTVMYFPEAFAAESLEWLEFTYPDAILASGEDAAVFGLNAVSDGLHVVLAGAATRLAGQLRDRGFEPIGVDLPELLKGGGSAKCCTLELRHRRPVATNFTPTLVAASPRG